jgi:predicted membrane channel-forming protein YqfA (hemolysin III family)
MLGDLDDSATIETVRRILLLILGIGLVGTATELVLLKHHEGPTQLIPLVLIGTACLVLVWHLATRSDVSVIALQITMVLFVASGLIGVVLHYQANLEFQLEIDPSAAGTALFWKVMEAKAPPALAPGSMVQLGLIGLAYSYRYRARARVESGISRP